MNTVVTYEAVRTLLANPPSINPRPNFFNIRELRSHFAKALKKIPCPQSPVNGWAGAVMSPEMYALIDQNSFHLNIAPTTTTPAYPNKFTPDGVNVPYTREEKSTIDAKFVLKKNYYQTWTNIYRACYDTLDEHVNDAYKVAPPTIPPTTGWNATMSIRDIFDQLASTYGKPTPDAMRQNNINFLAAYNPQDPPEILFKRCTDIQEIATLAKNPYTTQQLLINAIDLLARCGLYQRDLEDWERKPIADQTWINLRPFIQEAYQRRLTSGTITSAQGGFAQNNRFAGLATDVDSDDDTAETIAGTINSHMANLTAQTAATINEHATQTNASLQQLAANTTQLHQQQQAMMNQMAMWTMNNGMQAGGPAQQTFARPPTQIYQPAALPQYQQGYNNTPQQFGGRGGTAGGRGGGSRGGRARRGRGRGTPQGHIPPMPYVGGTQLVPYVPGGQQQSNQPNTTKYFSNQSVCFSCGFDVEDWHTSATCPRKKQGHQDGFTRANYMQYEQAGYPFCKKAMHKNVYPLA